MKNINIGIVGYGNIGRGVEKAVAHAQDMTLSCVVTRRDPQAIKLETQGVAVITPEEAMKCSDIDVMILCGGSATDLMVQGPQFVAKFNTVDSYDTHSRIPEYFDMMRSAAQDTLALISAGWDPGLFSLMRLLSGAILPKGETATFWGDGVSQGHSDAIRRIEGVQDATQYTVPVPQAIEQVRAGNGAALTTRDKHKRVCYVVLKDGADKQTVTQAIVSMPAYFADYDTAVHFVTQEELNAEHKKMPHGGFVVHSGTTSAQRQTMEFALKLESNPEFTGSVLVACARAVKRLYDDGRRGAVSMLDVPLGYYSTMDAAALRGELL
ncbi:MAG: diaminopimelate dehydrogenase [Oscillospiraceae bacterium]|nr:diaminopimelate dehydrogenase [Oscillospiraceae bacterium]